MNNEFNNQTTKIDISFCLPVYNVENFLKDCINSIVSQCTDEITYEIIAVDDLSTDNSYKILEKLKDTNPQIKLFKNDENKGVSYTRNRLISLANGKYIWFVDPDDMLYPGVVKLFFDKIENSDLNVILGNYITCNEDADFKNFEATNQPTAFNILSVDKDNYLPKSETGNPMCAIWAGMFKKSFLKENNLLFQEKMIAQEDTLFYYEFSLRLDNIIKYSQPCYIYRQRKTSVMHSKSCERSIKYYVSMRIMYDVYNNHLINDDYKDKQVLLNKIHHMKQNLAITLAGIPDTEYVKQEMKGLKKEKLYPFPFRKQALKSNENLLIRLLFFLQPIKPFFWLLHIIYKLKFKRLGK
ncbi:MAG: glycosyltransferase [Clostridia bacterium]|nr:glycosyltransferase [Clostridia bacterium]